MSFFRLWIPGQLAGMNEMLEDVQAFSRGPGGKRFSRYQSRRAEHMNSIGFRILAAKLPKMESAHFTYVFREPNRRRDPSNVLAGALKLVEDSLQKMGVLENDGWFQVKGIQPHWLVDPKHVGTTLFLGDRCLNYEDAIALDDYRRLGDVR